MIKLTAMVARHKSAKVAKTWCSLRLLSALCGYKNGIVIIFYVITALPLAGQPNITNAEYFFDNDPGVGSATPLSFTQGTSFDISPSLTQGLASGMHTLSVRAKDATGVWGFAERRQFYIPAGAASDPPPADITQAEYFFDNDPGVGSATPLSFTPGTSFDISPSLTQGLASGMHTLSVRAKDATGVWGLAERRQFYIPAGTASDPPPADITTMEYYIDNDPGHGMATTIIITTGGLVDLPNEIIAASALPQGFHTLGIRCMNTDGVWGIAEKRTFYVAPSSTIPQPPGDIVELEYFFDNDPGFGNATSLTISAGQVIDINPLIPESLSAGRHTISVRAKNTDGVWGIAEKRTIYINPTVAGSPIPDITKIEYYFDGADPGIGNGIDLPITPGQVIDLNTIDVPTSPSLVDGEHYITFRAQNGDGVWGVAETSTFDVLDDCNQPVVDFSYQLACAGEPVQFIDNSTTIQPDAQYRWYFNGDNVADDFTSGNTSFTFNLPGTYDIGLAVSQGTICYDSIGYQITIKPKPVVLFSVSGLLTDFPTNFEAAFSNVDPAATWEWDFDNDANIDDNTVGSTSYTYTTAATYTAVVRVTDGLGCETSYSQIFVVGDGSGGGGGTPVADFLANAVCESETTQFLDISSNISPTALYSWDFEDDGIVDDNTFGTTSYTYPSPGDYTVKLSIDVGGGIIKEKTKQVTIKPIPVTSFTVADICDGETANFIDATLGLYTGGVYNWDFDGDGVIDSNDTGDVNFTFSQPGTYSALLLVDNGSGCFASFTKQVKVIPVPVPDFDISGGCTGASVVFSDISAGIAVGANYSWDFDGDGVEDSNLITGITFVFDTAGIFLSRLTIDNGTGCLTLIEKNVEITETSVALFDVSDGCSAQAIRFTDLSSGNLSNAIYSWDFDNDGITDSTTVGDVTFIYTNPGTYTILLKVETGNQCVSTYIKTVNIQPVPIPQFLIAGGCSGTEFIFFDESTGIGDAAVYSWDFNGDGVEDSNQQGDAFYTFDVPGTYNVSLTIDNGVECITVVTQSIDVSEIPIPDFEIISECFGLPSVFIDYSANVSVNALYSWDFDGDGMVDDNTAGNTTYTYTELKPMVAKLIIDNGLGCVNSVDVIVDFKNAAAPDFKVGNACLNVETVFTNLSSELATGAIYSWDFNGDGLEDSATPGSTSFVYEAPGTYAASLTIFNADLCSATKTIQVEVSEIPGIDLGEDVQLCTEGTVTLDAGAGYASYFWIGGSTNQTLTVDIFGEYWVSITDVKGCSNIDTIQVRLKDLPGAVFEYQISYSPLDGIIVQFENLSTSTDTWAWDFGDGGVSNEAFPSHIYADFSFYEETPYQICLTASDVCGKSDVFCTDILLSPLALINDREQSGITIYPNPGSGVFMLTNMENPENIEEIIILNTSGKMIRQIKPANPQTGIFEIDISDQVSGMYFILIKNGENQIIKRVILNKDQ